nr:hypothetical protein TCT1_36600 [Xenorhabdus sp. TCT-1]
MNVNTIFHNRSNHWEHDPHLEQAEKLYDFYVKYLQVKEKTSVNLGRVLHKLYSTGSIKEAEIVLEEIKAQAGVTA